MNNYHVYEAIGRGKHSTVYKGRKKKTLEYFAIKSVDKSQRSRVLQEVRALHALDHPNILKFYSCYETSAHLWLVLEYCVGGDLRTLLQQDARLPEDSIHDLGRDLLKALQYLHAKGVIYCDLKPSNILLDENGRTKLCDFGLARSLADISKSSLSMLPQGKRGTPYYMAPELFQDGGVHSYASDFWALGCVLYECYAGRPPFAGSELTQLVKSILADPVPSLPDNASSSFVNLVARLLAKDPNERIQWPELCEHAFWRSKFTAVPLPPQPAFVNMLELFTKPCLSESNSDRSAQQQTPKKFESNRKQKHDENYPTATKGSATPVKGSQNDKKMHAKTVSRLDDKRKDASNIAKRANILRLSRIAKSNLQRENEKDNYRRPLTKEPENNNVEVTIENNDMELDFRENHDDEALEDSEGPQNSSCNPGEDTASHIPNKDGPEDTELRANTLEVDGQQDINAALPDETSSDAADINTNVTAVVATPSSSILHTKVPCKEGNVYESNLNSDLSDVMWHPSDLSVKPVMPSRKCDKTLEALPVLPFEAPVACDFTKLSPEQLEALNGHILQSLSNTSQLSEKQNVIRYIEMMCLNNDAANILVNGPVMPILVKILRLSKSLALRIQLASAIGSLFRHSTFIGSDLANSGIINILADGLRDKQDKLRRSSMAALGELLFYISTLTEKDKDTSSLESPSKHVCCAPCWQVPSAVISLVTSILRKGEDDITQLYALRTIENITSQGGDWASRFTNKDVIGNLCYIYKAIGKQESTRLTAGSCLVRLARFNPASISMVFDKISLKETASTLIKGNPREQQICLNLLAIAMIHSKMIANVSRHIVLLSEEKLLVPSLISLVEQGSEVLRGKSLIFLAFLCKNSRRWLPHFFCNAKLLSAIERVAKERGHFIQQCIESFVQLVICCVPLILEAVRADIQQMMSAKRHAISNLTGRGNSKSTCHLFPVILHLLGCSTFKHRVVNEQVLSLLAGIIKQMESPFQGRDDFQIALLQILETISEDAALINDNSRTFTSQFLPSIAILYKGNKDADARFLSLKILFDVIAVVIAEISDDVTSNEPIKKDLESISETYFLPLYPTLIEDEDPIPMYAQKLLVMLIEFNYVKVSSILSIKTVTKCFEFLHEDLSSANVSNVKLCLAIASSPEIDMKILSQLRVVRKIGNLLDFVNAKDMDDFLEPTLALCRGFILGSVGRERGSLYLKDPSLLIQSTIDAQFILDPQKTIKDISDFGSYIGIFLELMETNDQQVANLASECAVLLLKSAPREATMGFLTSLPKVNSVLQSLEGSCSNTLLLRILYSVAFACQIYLSQALILSISVSDLRRIEVVVSRLKGSDIAGVAKASSVLALELQRLPRCA